MLEKMLFPRLLAVALLSAGMACHAASGSQGVVAAKEDVQTQKSTVLPPSSRMAFDVKGKVSGINYSAKATLEWQLNQQGYRAFQEVRIPVVGTRSQLSVGGISAQGLEPARFEDSRKNRVLHFDQRANTVRYPGAAEVVPMPAAAQDRLSVFFQLASMVASDAGAQEQGKRLEIPTVSVNKQDVWVFEVVGPETLNLPAGQIQTLKLRRLPRKAGDDQVSEIWLAPQWRFMPVRILVSEDGDMVDLRLQQRTPI